MLVEAATTDNITDPRTDDWFRTGTSTGRSPKQQPPPPQQQQQGPLPQSATNYFLGFAEVDSSPKLRELWQRLEVLEKWNELAIRPRTADDCHPDDRFLWAAGTSNGDENDGTDDGDGVFDDLEALRKQWCHVRDLFNRRTSITAVETTRWERDLVVRPSQIPNAGMGLYYDPVVRERTRTPCSYEDENENYFKNEHQDKTRRADGTSTVTGTDRNNEIPAGTLICYYTGHVHTHSSSRKLIDRSYLMWIRGNTLVDPGPLPNITARYINDPLNEQLVNCRFVPTTTLATTTTTATTTTMTTTANGAECKNDGGADPHPDTMRTSVFTTRSIRPGEELFIRYGDAYWNQQPIPGNTLVVLNDNNTVRDAGATTKPGDKDSLLDNDHGDNDNEDDDDDDDDDIDATFLFSSSFNPKLFHESLVSDT